MDKPWIEGPKELLQHAAEHINGDKDFDNRIAFISIDNSIEITIKTYMSLPKRIRKDDGPSRKELQDAENSFPTYLDLIEKYGQNKLSSISLEDIEWYHRLRNQLYHNGNGLTIEKAKVEAYFEIAKTMFETLFDDKLSLQHDIEYTTLFGKFMQEWMIFESQLREMLPPKDGELAYYWKRDFLSSIDKKLVPVFNEVMNFRNEVVHGVSTPTVEDFNEYSNKLKYLKERLDNNKE